MKYILNFILVCFFICLLQNNLLQAQSRLCQNATQLCDNISLYPAGVMSGDAPRGNNYDCLFTQPNPAWFYFKIASSGSVIIDLLNTQVVDVDFVLYGPFASEQIAFSQCGNLGYGGAGGNVVDCSYDPQAYEQININNAVAGQVYLLLITNYSDAPTQIYTNPNLGTAEISCPCNYTQSFDIVNTANNSGEFLGVNASGVAQYSVCVGDTLFAELLLDSPIPLDSLYLRATGTTIQTVLSTNEFSIYGPFQTNAGSNNSVSYQILLYPSIARSGVINFSLGTAVNRVGFPNYCKNIANFSVMIPGIITQNYEACSGASLQLQAMGLNNNIVGNSNFTWRHLSGTNVVFSDSTIANPMLTISTYSADITQPILLEVENNYAFCSVKDTVQIILQNNKILLPESPLGNCGVEPVNLYAMLQDTFAHTNACYPDYDLYAIDYTLLPGMGNTVTLRDDEMSGALPIGFSFQFYCNSYSNFYISSNGFITFSPAQVSGASNTSIPNIANPNNLIALAWDDLDPSAGIGNIQYFTRGVAPNRELIVSFTNIRYRGSSSKSITGQIILYETSNIIEFQVQRIDNNNSGTTQGIENASGRSAIAVNGRNNGNFISDREGFRFIPRPGAAIPTAPTYTWAPATELNNANIYNPIANPNNTTTYVVSITDGACTYSDSITVYIDSMPIELIAVQPICNNNGSITVVTNFGQSPYNYQWSTGANTASINNLQNGIYSVTVSDVRGCMGTKSIALVSENLLDYTYTSTTVNCSANGSINLEFINGQAPYTVLWNTGATTQNLSALNSGIYQATIVDAAGCEIQTDYIRIEESSNIININLDDLQNNVCADAATGFISINAVSSAMPLFYNWSTGASTTSINNLQKGEYWLTVTDANGCSQVSEIFAITSPQIPILNLSINNPLCFGDSNGRILVESTDTLLPLLYQWSNGESSNMLSNLAAHASYTLSITNNANCVYEYGPFSVQEPALLTATATIQNVTCNGANDGKIQVLVDGGVLPYSFAWSTAATSQNLSNLSAGNYTLTITDKNGCIFDFPQIAAFEIIEHPALIISIDSIVDLLCAESTDGAIYLSVQGGLAPYSYDWSNGESTRNIENLSANTYVLTLTDAANCIKIYEDAQLNIPLPIKINLNIIQGVIACDFSPIGAVNAIATDGVGAYNYIWSNAATTANINNLAAGIYMLTVTDENLCQAIDSVQIIEPLLPQLSAFYTGNIQVDSCFFVGEIISLNALQNAQNNVLYSWQQLSNNLPFVLKGDMANFSVNAAVVQAGNYNFLVTASATTGNITCEQIDTLNICVKDYYNLFLPTAFSPNGDGENDIYRPIELSTEYIKSFKIYNRWGNLLYDNNTLSDGGWDATYKGELQPREVYLAVLEYKLPAMAEAVVYKTEFTLLR